MSRGLGGGEKLDTKIQRKKRIFGNNIPRGGEVEK